MRAQLPVIPEAEPQARLSGTPIDESNVPRSRFGALLADGSHRPRNPMAGMTGAIVTEPETSIVDINGFATRVWRKGSGPRIGFLAGYGGLPKWVPFLDRLAEKRTVIVPSLPGFPGGDRGHTILDTHLDWVLAIRDLIDKSDLAGADL